MGGDKRETMSLLERAELVLPWLPPSALASISITCNSLHRVAKSINLRRSLDASRALEKHSIPFVNPRLGDDDREPYAYFLYTPFSILGTDFFVPISQSWGGNLDGSSFESPEARWISSEEHLTGISGGCLCRSDCTVLGTEGCPCVRLNELLSGKESNSGVLMMECGSACSCGTLCANRLTQRGISVKLRIVKHLRKGWGLHAVDIIPRGQFVCEYAGELLTTEESRKRQQAYDRRALGGRFSPALLVVREHFPSGKACLRLNIDATRIANVGRFINHSCDGGNLSTVLVRNSGALLPRLCFFAARDILEGEELSFSYGNVSQAHQTVPCFCGSSNCLGVLPCEPT